MFRFLAENAYNEALNRLVSISWTKTGYDRKVME